MWFQVLELNTNNFRQDVFDPKVGPEQVIALGVRVELGVMTIKR